MSSASSISKQNQVKLTHLASLGKPNSMAQQNEYIKRMLGMSTPDAAEEAMSASSLMRKSSRLAPIESLGKIEQDMGKSASSFTKVHRANSQVGKKKSLIS
jgi:hypothetical protein